MLLFLLESGEACLLLDLPVLEEKNTTDKWASPFIYL